MSFYVTTPIYYVNAEPHLGHAYSTIGADVLARHMRQRGEDVFFVTGTDEHGEPVVLAAEAQGTTPQELVDRNAPRFESLLERIDVTNDFFIRTTNPAHVAEVQRVWQQIYDNGYVYKGNYEGWYCPKCADFKGEHEIAEGNACPIHKIPLDRESEESWFFKLSAFQAPLEKLFADQPDFVLPKHRCNEALSFINSGLRDVALSRSKISWGVELPWDPSHVMYVWFDALLNYWTAPKIARPDDEIWPASVHVMAKDIVKFHAVYWPAMLMALEAPLPKRMFVHGYLLMDGEKMSKSLGNVLDPNKVVDLFGSDALRFYCFREVSFGNDGSISTEGFETRYNTDLANDYGNLASRSLAMITKYRDGVVPAKPESTGLEVDFIDAADKLATRIDALDLTSALEEVWVLVRRLNRFVEERAPWKLAKDESPEAQAELDATLYGLAEGLRVVSILLQPYIPKSTRTLLTAIGHDGQVNDLSAAVFGAGAGGFKIDSLSPLFPKLEPSAA
ncbi:MAG: methionine--tRNA ligase [Solirubrobacterales bacterium]|nr:methionine--tRNA ligase [Solirubrobacterales bacterium]